MSGCGGQGEGEDDNARTTRTSATEEQKAASIYAFWMGLTTKSGTSR
jgi:hypothetical protein